MEIPVLETERLRIRSHTMKDFSASFAMWSEPEVTRYIGGKPSTEQQAWSRFLGYRGHWSFMGFGYWAVEERSNGKFIGEVGFADYKREIEPTIQGIPESGWAFIPVAQGKGFATEALKAITAWGDLKLGSRKTTCIITPGNLPSLRVAEKCGYQESIRTKFNGETVILFYREKGVV